MIDIVAIDTPTLGDRSYLVRPLFVGAMLSLRHTRP